MLLCTPKESNTTEAGAHPNPSGPLNAQYAMLTTCPLVTSLSTTRSYSPSPKDPLNLFPQALSSVLALFRPRRIKIRQSLLDKLQHFDSVLVAAERDTLTSSGKIEPRFDRVNQ